MSRLLALASVLATRIAFADSTVTLEAPPLHTDPALLAQIYITPPPPPVYLSPPPVYVAPPPVYVAPPPPPVYVVPPAPPLYIAPMAPRPMHYETRPRTGLMVGGLVLFGVFWLTDVSITYGLGHNPAWESLVPLIGPILQMRDGLSTNPNSLTAPGYYNESSEAVARTFLAFDFVMQAVGLTMAIIGATTSKQVRVYGESPGAKVRFALTPGPGGHGHGFAVRW